MALDDDPSEASGSDVARKAVAGVAAAAVGIALMPAVGPVGSAMAAGALVPVFEQLALRDRRAAESAARAAERAAELAAKTPEELAEWAEASPRRLALLANVIEAAWRLASDEKTEALARVLADGVRDDARLDVDPLFVAALREMDPAHVQTLRLMADAGNPHDQPSGRPAGASQEWATEHLHEALPQLSEGMDYIVATLERIGCIARGVPRWDVPAWWSVTEFGHATLRFLRTAPDRSAD
ncbi:hypothetical protein [Kribbella sp. NBC_00889]|uniref:hypothetical protein n=1 Tax=Kribbella sp. NBC_00889 TaxID=2975974 RepID=UPI00386A4BBB|nr:hypothetical protein OG817_00150 [Kribbella sp. NBC_00889]